MKRFDQLGIAATYLAARTTKPPAFLSARRRAEYRAYWTGYAAAIADLHGWSSGKEISSPEEKES